MTDSAPPRKPIPEAVAEDLRLRILRGELRVGERLPPERELAPAFGTNRNTLREAMRALEAQGLVTARRGDGVRVNDFRLRGELSLLPDLIRAAEPTERGAIVSDVLRMRRRMAVEMAALAAREAGPAEVERLRRLLRRQEEAAGDLLATLTTDLELYESMTAATGSVVASLLFHAMARLSRACMERVPALIYVNPNYLAHMTAVVDAIEAGDPQGAAGALDRLFEETDAVLMERVAALG